MKGLPQYTLFAIMSTHNSAPQFPHALYIRKSVPVRHRDSLTKTRVNSSRRPSNARILLVDWMPSIILIPIFTHPLRLSKCLLPTKRLDNVPLALQNLQPEACAHMETLAQVLRSTHRPVHRVVGKSKTKDSPAEACQAIWQCRSQTPGLSGLNAMAM